MRPPWLASPLASLPGAGTGVALIADDLPKLAFSMPLSRRSAQHRLARRLAAFGLLVLLIPATLTGWASREWPS